VNSRPQAATPSSESYQPVSRGLRKHLAALSGNAVKLYLELLLSANFAGPNKGQVATTFVELAARLKMHRTTVHRAAKKLQPRYIMWEGAKNQLDTTIFTIVKYKSVKDFACSAPVAVALQACVRHVSGTCQAPHVTHSEHKDLQAPKKLKEAIRKKQQRHAAWISLKIAPCGPLVFQNLVESNFETRNGSSLTSFMSHCLNEWDLIRGSESRPREFCKRKAQIRDEEENVGGEIAQLEEAPAWANR
jgi:hypothetical protein